MGQRLNIEITRKGKPLANAYYHWSGYTCSSYERFCEVYDCLSTYHDEKDKKLLAMKALESTGAGFIESDIKRLKRNKNYYDISFNLMSDRNSGIISYTNKGIESTRKWAEGTIKVDIDTLLIDFNVACYYEDFNEVKEYFEDITEDEIEEFDFDTTNMDFGCLKDFIHALYDGKVVHTLDGYYSEIA